MIPRHPCLGIALVLMTALGQAAWAERDATQLKMQSVTTISFREAGGFVRRYRGCDLSIEKLPAGEAASLQALIDQSRIWTLKPGPFDGALAPDEIGYTIFLQSSADKRTIKYGESKVPKALWPLIQFLRSRSVDLPREN